MVQIFINTFFCSRHAEIVDQIRLPGMCVCFGWDKDGDLLAAITGMSCFKNWSKLVQMQCCSNGIKLVQILIENLLKLFKVGLYLLMSIRLWNFKDGGS